MNAEKQQLEQQLWNIANTLRGKMGADDFRDYILGFIFYKYLSNKMHAYANEILKSDGMTYKAIDENTEKGQEYLDAVRQMALDTLGYFLKPSELFSEMARRGNSDGKSKFIHTSVVIRNIVRLAITIPTKLAPVAKRYHSPILFPRWSFRSLLNNLTI